MSTNTKSQAETNTAGATQTLSGITHVIRDLISIQLRTAQFIMDKSVGVSQNLAEFYQNQLNETVKLSQECTKVGWAVTENVKNTAVEVTERVVRGISA